MEDNWRSSVHRRRRFNVLASFVSANLFSLLLLLILWERCSAVCGRLLPAAETILQHTGQGWQTAPHSQHHSQQALALSRTFLSLGGGGGSFSSDNVRRRLIGPGSSPPNCASKCGKCTPCKAVRVPIQPGKSAGLTDYYPEAWRCQCGKKLYMP